MTTADNSATETPWSVEQHGNLFCVRGPSAIPNCTEESYWHEHEQQAQWLCDALNRAAALHSANEKLRGECENLRTVAHYRLCMIKRAVSGERLTTKHLKQCDYNTAARAAEGGEDR